MNPLERILNWLENQSEELQKELIDLSGHFHLNEQIDIEFDKEEKIKLYKEFLASEGLTKSEILKRCLYIIKLIDFSLTGRDSEAGWTEALDKNIIFANRAKEKGRDIDQLPTKSFFDNFQERKEMWINASAYWYTLTSTELSNKAIADWYFFGQE